MEQVKLGSRTLTLQKPKSYLAAWDTLLLAGGSPLRAGVAALALTWPDDCPVRITAKLSAHRYDVAAWADEVFASLVERYPPAEIYAAGSSALGYLAASVPTGPAVRAATDFGEAEKHE